jgi:hypothetical protein
VLCFFPRRADAARTKLDAIVFLVFLDRSRFAAEADELLPRCESAERDVVFVFGRLVGGRRLFVASSVLPRRSTSCLWSIATADAPTFAGSGRLR